MVEMPMTTCNEIFTGNGTSLPWELLSLLQEPQHGRETGYEITDISNPACNSTFLSQPRQRNLALYQLEVAHQGVLKNTVTGSFSMLISLPDPAFIKTNNSILDSFSKTFACVNSYRQ